MTTCTMKRKFQDDVGPPRTAKRANTGTNFKNRATKDDEDIDMVIAIPVHESTTQGHASIDMVASHSPSSSSSSSPSSLPSTSTMSFGDSDSNALTIDLLGDLFNINCNMGSTEEESSSPQHTNVKPLGDRVLVKIKDVDENAQGGILLAQSKTQGGEVVAVGEGKTVGKNKVDVSVKAGAQVVCSKYAGTEVEFNGSKHLILKDDDIVGILETGEVKDLKPLNDRVLIKVTEAEEKTAGGLLLTEATKDKPSIGTVIAVGPGLVDDEGNRKPLSISPGNTVLYSKYAGNDFKAKDGSDYIALRASDVMAILS